MSLIDDLLITIDDKPGITKEEILTTFNDHQSKTAVFSALARLEARGFCERRSPGYSITKEGKQRIDYYLDALAEYKNDNKKWQLILIEIPESRKLLREKLRYEFRKIGVGSVKKGVFVVYGDSKRDNVAAMLHRLGLSDRSLVLKLENIHPRQAQQIADRAWDWHDLNLSYQSFLNSYNGIPHRFHNHSHDLRRIEAKKAVFEFAKLLAQDPKVPDNLAPAGYLRKKAFRLYNEIQPFCYD